MSATVYKWIIVYEGGYTEENTGLVRLILLTISLMFLLQL